ncbi:hypothetical protein ES319_D10G006400v1 [Gossypium barbadense]|uniref:Uncharacterized protein n=2 Tax=Gossypium TaxID=3633 RepID=A0A5J5PK39_GOSBA|nr:hypothetical protein ES319_D10G006400v1 [Gossypium barbadense]TYG48355.1 hypothetical protein ES288_D10G006500v1 [Gossypium darwinii]
MSTAVTACISSTNISHHQITEPVRSVPLSPPSDVPSLSRYESQKRRDWTTGAHVLGVPQTVCSLATFTHRHHALALGYSC